jgi:hypothetical protein
MKSKGQVNYEGFYARSTAHRDPWEKVPDEIRRQWEHAADQVIGWQAEELIRSYAKLSQAVSPLVKLVVSAGRDILLGGRKS